MKVLLSWMREFAPDLDLPPAEMGDRLSEIGLECEDVRPLGHAVDGIVVARVLALRPHPDADRIQLVDVDPGDGGPLQICCGAFNMAEGDLVPLAPVGATLPGGLEIARRKLRGEWSEGMLCSAAELELGDDHSGILLLPAGSTPGSDLAEALGMAGDVLFDLSITPNRPDGSSVIGVTRDLAAALGVPFGLPSIEVPVAGAPVTELADVEVDDPRLCGRFTARVLSGVTVGPSPAHIARRLTLCGMRPINSIVDISNYVMLEYGQPNHTYDLDRLAGGRLRVRRAAEGEELTTLDGQSRRLAAGDGVLVDADDDVVGIAGVMGGASTEISADTTDVLLELAWWEPVDIARTAARLGLRSEASARFERGVDPDIAAPAADRFAQLAAGVGATLHPGQIVVEGELPERRPVLVRTGRVNEVLGTSLSRQEMAAVLDPIGFGTAPEGDDLRVRLPTWRPDATAEVDVIEEIARMVGYERIGKTVPRSPHRGALTADQLARREVRAVLVGLGCDEVMPMPFLAPGDLERVGVRTDAVRLSNPLVAEESVLRTALLPGLLATLAYNATHRAAGLSVFELGHCYARPAGPGEMPVEWAELGVALAGREAPAAVHVAAAVTEVLGLDRPRVVPAEAPGLHPTRAGTVWVGEVAVGEVGEVDPDIAAAAGVAERVAWLRLDLDVLLALPRSLRQHRPVSRYPTADIDLAFVVDESIPVHEVTDLLRRASDLVAEVRLFDVYRGPQVGDRARSLAFGLRLQAADRTLTDAEVAEVRAALIEAVTSGLDAGLRA